MAVDHTLRVLWEGPYSWPKWEAASGLAPLPSAPGVYLQAFEYRDGHIIYAAGITTRHATARFREHTRHYMNGEYNVLDPGYAEQGLRKEIWHGWGYARAHREEFKARKEEIQDAVGRQLARFRLFLARASTDRRILERIEAAIIKHLERESAPFSALPDRGMRLMPRLETESPMTLISESHAKLHALPRELAI